MLYPTANQSLLLLVVALIGFGCGFVYNLATLCTYLCAKKVFAKQLFSLFCHNIFLFYIFFDQFAPKLWTFSRFPNNRVFNFFDFGNFYFGKIVDKMVGCVV